ncbi:hypothetical protein HDV00_006353 [Rhizophlyctis rosea]|nr:hypothetical protein HDV00_006353 [Rhizophlyctis rosea]
MELSYLRVSLVKVPSSTLTTPTSKSPSDAIYPLEKRSSRSHVTGDIRVQAYRVTEPCWNDEYSPFQVIPPQPRVYYMALLRKLVNFDLAAGSGEGGEVLSQQSRAVLNNVATVWRVDETCRAVAFYSSLGALYVQGIVPINVLCDEGFEPAYGKLLSLQLVRNDDMQEFIRTSESILNLLKHHLTTFFNQAVTRQSGKQLDYTVQMIESLYSMPHFSGEGGAALTDATRVALTNSIEARYHGLYAMAHANRSDPPSLHLATLVKSIDRELRLYYAHLDNPLLRDIHIPTIAAQVYLGKLAVYMDTFASTFVASQPDLADAFELYGVVREFVGTVGDIDVGLTGRLTVEQWFRPFVVEWLKISEEKTREWVTNAIKLDKFEPTSSTALYSTSVLDIFASFQQQLDVLAQLQWPDPEESQAFVDTLLENMTNALERYCSILSRSAIEDRELKDRQAHKGNGVVKSGGTSPNMKRKLTFHMKKLRKSKEVPVDPGELRFSPEACVRLNNIEEMTNRMAQLRAPEPSQPNPSFNPTPPHRLPIPSKYLLLKISLIGAQNISISRPYTTRLLAKITAPALAGGRELARTKAVRQRPTVQWGETFCCLVLDREFEDGLVVQLVQVVPGKGEYVVGMASVARGVVGEDVVRVGGGMGVVVSVERWRGGSGEFLRERVGWVAGVHERVIVDFLADKLCHDLRDRLKSLSNKHREAPMKSLMGKLRPSETNLSNLLHRSPSPSPSLPPSPTPSTSSHLSLLTDATVEEDLAPLLQHVNVNLEVLTGSMDHVLALRVVRGLWERVLVVLEGLLVPGLGEEDGEVKAKEERRVSWCRWAMEILAAFFNGEGEGLPFSELHTERFVQLRALTEAYFTPRRELEVRYLEMIRNGGGDDEGGEGDDGEEPEKLDWMLKLIKLRGGKEFVEQQMRLRFYGRRV